MYRNYLYFDLEFADKQTVSIYWSIDGNMYPNVIRNSNISIQMTGQIPTPSDKGSSTGKHISPECHVNVPTAYKILSDKYSYILYSGESNIWAK